MGSSASTITEINNEYNFTGNNNGFSMGEQGVYGTSTGASTDVKPTSDMNYSPQINPDWGGLLGYAGRGIRSKVIGNLTKTSNLIDAARHIGSAAIRVSMGDSNLVDEAKKVVNKIIKDDDDDVNVNKQRDVVSVDEIKKLVELQKNVIDNFETAHDAYGTVALGMTGMRNNEINTSPTDVRLQGLYNRASDDEKMQKDEIINTVGPRMGIVPYDVSVRAGTVIQESLDNCKTKHGTIGDVKQAGEKAFSAMNKVKFSTLHATGVELGQHGLIPINSWETKQFVGIIKQRSISLPTQGIEVTPGGWIISLNKSYMLTPKRPISGDTIVKSFLPTTYALMTVVDDIEFRKVNVIITGRVVIDRQPYDPSVAIYVGLLYMSNDSTTNFIKCNMINTDVITETHTNIYNDHRNISFTYLHTVQEQIDKAKTKKKLFKKGEKIDYVYDQNVKFSYDSSFQGVVDISQLPDTWMDLLFNEGEHNLQFKFLVAIGVSDSSKLDTPIKANLSIESPTVRVETIANPTTGLLMGRPYNGTILDLLGTIPPWYSTGDNHDVTYIYKSVIKPLIPYLGRIAHVHTTSGGAALALSIKHVESALKRQGSKIFSNDQVIQMIKKIIVTAPQLLEDNSVITEFKQIDRKVIFMHLIEKVCIQLLTHIEVYKIRNYHLRDKYVRDCKYFNMIEKSYDDVKPEC